MNSTDIYFFRVINNLGESFPYLNPFIIFMAEYSIFLLALYMVASWFFNKDKINNRIMFVCSIGSFVMAEIIGKLVGKIIQHVQPFATLENVNQLIAHDIDNSFPSDHTILFFSITVSIFFFYRNKRGTFALLVAGIVGVSRIWVGVHYPGDVLAAIFISGIAAFTFYILAMKTNAVDTIVHFYNTIERKVLKLKKA